MGNSCVQNSQVNIQRDENSSSEGNYCINPELPITNNEIQLLKESWTTVSQEWNEICTMAFQRYDFAFYYPTELNNAFWLAKSRSIWRRMDRLQREFEIWQEKVLNRIINYKETAQSFHSWKMDLRRLLNGPHCVRSILLRRQSIFSRMDLLISLLGTIKILNSSFGCIIVSDLLP